MQGYSIGKRSDVGLLPDIYREASHAGFAYGMYYQDGLVVPCGYPANRHSSRRAAREAEPQMDPLSSGFEALFAAVRGARFDIANFARS